MDIKQIKRLRELTGVGITDAKRALAAAGGDFEAALAAMRAQGLTKAEKRAEREARAGMIGSYVHDGRIGVLIEVNCETDFVARNDLFKELVKDLTLQVAAAAPQYVSLADVPPALKKDLEKEFSQKAKSEGKPAKAIPLIVKGMLEKHFAQICLLEQPFVKNPEQTVGNYIKEYIAKLGENIVVRRFNRLELGEVA